jgi:ribosomal protein L37E
MPNPKKPRLGCLHCGKEQYRSFYKYCSNACQFEHQYEEKIRAWKVGQISGLQSFGVVSSWVKKYLRLKFGDQCVICGWSEVNPKTGVVPVVADHIDGNWKNNAEDNLRLLCPNCDSLTSTYAALNKGNGRENRAVSKRAKEARLFTNKKQ